MVRDIADPHIRVEGRRRIAARLEEGDVRVRRRGRGGRSLGAARERRDLGSQRRERTIAEVNAANKYFEARACDRRKLQPIGRRRQEGEGGRTRHSWPAKELNG